MARPAGTWPPCEGRQRPKRKRSRFLSAGDVAAVLAGLQGHQLHEIANLAISTGARRGELLALRWADVDLSAGVIKIERSLEETKGGLRIKPPKTETRPA